MSEKRPTNREMLFCMDVKLTELGKQFSNHIKHHWMVTIPMMTITGGAIAALIIALLTK